VSHSKRFERGIVINIHTYSHNVFVIHVGF